MFFFFIYLVFLWLSSVVSRLTNIFLYSANFFSSGTEKNILQSKKYLCSLWYHPHPLFKKTVKSKKYIQKYFFSYTRRILLQGKKVKWLKLILSRFLIRKYVFDDKTHKCCKWLLAKTHIHDYNSNKISSWIMRN